MDEQVSQEDVKFSKLGVHCTSTGESTSLTFGRTSTGESTSLTFGRIRLAGGGNKSQTDW